MLRNCNLDPVFVPHAPDLDGRCRIFLAIALVPFDRGTLSSQWSRSFMLPVFSTTQGGFIWVSLSIVSLLLTVTMTLCLSIRLLSDISLILYPSKSIKMTWLVAIVFSESIIQAAIMFSSTWVGFFDKFVSNIQKSRSMMTFATLHVSVC